MVDQIVTAFIQFLRRLGKVSFRFRLKRRSQKASLVLETDLAVMDEPVGQASGQRRED